MRTSHGSRALALPASTCGVHVHRRAITCKVKAGSIIRYLPRLNYRRDQADCARVPGIIFSGILEIRTKAPRLISYYTPGKR